MLNTTDDASAPSSVEVSAATPASSEEPAAAASSSEAPAPAAVADTRIPAAALTGDVGIAAPGSTAEGFGYVGVWAKDPATCAAIGTPGATDFAVITIVTFRNGPSAAYGNFGPLVDGKTTLKGGATSVAIEQSAPDALTIDGAAYVRCTP